MKAPRILLFDIETAPIILYIWALGMEVWSPEFIRRNWFVLCWSAKWLGKKKIYRSALPDYRGYKELPSKTTKNIDKKVMLDLWKLLDEADIVVAHNLKAFDRKKSNTRFIINGIKPPSHYDLVDTLTVARTQFKFTSNKLGYLADKLGVEHKLDDGGFTTWKDIEDGKAKAWRKMIKYCDGDIAPLEGIYRKMEPWMPRHPYHSAATPEAMTKKYKLTRSDQYCLKSECEGVGTMKDGIRRTHKGMFQKLRCKGCGELLLRYLK